MKPGLIVMLTHNDKTVNNALELFDNLSDLPVKYWGFKNVGLSPDKMRTLINKIHSAGKTSKLEVVSVSEDMCLEAAKLAVKLGINVLMGTKYYDSINNYLKGKSVKYVPFIGSVSGHPNILEGSIEDIVAQARKLEEKGVDGIDLLTYRYTGNAQKLLKEVVKSTNLRIVSAGSIDSFDRISEVSDAGAWSFTIGSAFFEKKFAAAGTIRDNVSSVCDWMQKTGN